MGALSSVPPQVLALFPSPPPSPASALCLPAIFSPEVEGRECQEGWIEKGQLGSAEEGPQGRRGRGTEEQKGEGEGPQKKTETEMETNERRET